jgi:5-methylcytosine-specific restriction endonuclease McrA
MEQTLLLNATFEPLTVVAWQRAVTLLWQGKVEVVESYDRDVHSVRFTFKLPSVVRLLRYVRILRKEHVPFTRANIYARDAYRCQYCGDSFPTEELTFDHVIPQAAGGAKTWDNIATACVDCNRRKGGRTPDQAGMTLRRAPRRPPSLLALHVTVGLRHAPKSWADYCYWSVELEQD